MFVYEKKLQYPVNIKQTNAKLAKIIITQYGGAYSKTYKKQAVRYKSATARSEEHTSDSSHEIPSRMPSSA